VVAQGLASDERLRRARVRAQLLGPRRPRRDVTAVVSAIAGVQAQDGSAAALSIRARSTGLVAADVWRAAAETRSLVLTWSLRGTRHLHHTEDVRWLVGVLGPVFGRPGRRARELGVSGTVGDDAVSLVRRALAEDGPLSRRQITERLASHGVDPAGQAPIHVIRRAALEAWLCVVPDAASEERYVLLDDWVPPSPGVDPEDALAELARRHLAAYGPATPADLAAWSGLGITVANRAWAAIGGELTEVAWRGGTQWVLASRRRAVTGPTAAPAPVRLLGGFDALLLGYRDRTPHLPRDRARNVNAGGGLLKPIVVADGRVIGTWRHRREGSTVGIEVSAFERITPAERSALDRETRDVGRFLGLRPMLRIGSAPTA
jgi:Winged helix DNA-binding domain